MNVGPQWYGKTVKVHKGKVVRVKRKLTHRRQQTHWTNNYSAAMAYSVMRGFAVKRISGRLQIFYLFCDLSDDVDFETEITSCLVNTDIAFTLINDDELSIRTVEMKLSDMTKIIKLFEELSVNYMMQRRLVERDMH